MPDYKHGRWIPNPLGPDKPEILVKSAEEHQAKNPADYEQALLEAPTTGKTVQEAVNDERQRCAAVARNFQRAFGSEIADAIMGKGPTEPPKQQPPTITEIMKAGYKADAAEKIHAEEQEKAAKGYPPYGNNEPAPPAEVPVAPHAWRDPATAPPVTPMAPTGAQG